MGAASCALPYSRDGFPGTVTAIGTLSDGRIFGIEGKFSGRCCGGDILDDDGTPRGCPASGFDIGGGRLTGGGCAYSAAAAGTVDAMETFGMGGKFDVWGTVDEGGRFDGARGTVDGGEAPGVGATEAVSATGSLGATGAPNPTGIMGTLGAAGTLNDTSLSTPGAMVTPAPWDSAVEGTVSLSPFLPS